MKNLVVVLLGGSSGEREISFLTGRACSSALKKKGYRVKEIDGKGNFVNKGNATSSDLEDLIHKVRTKVLDKTGIKLELEIQIIGEKT